MNGGGVWHGGGLWHLWLGDSRRWRWLVVSVGHYYRGGAGRGDEHRAVVGRGRCEGDHGAEGDGGGEDLVTNLHQHGLGALLEGVEDQLGDVGGGGVEVVHEGDEGPVAGLGAVALR